jgi:hypothetical protein
VLARLRPLCRFAGSLLLVLACGTLGTGCRFVSTPLARILRAPARYQGLEVTVEGRVEGVRWIAATGASAYCLAEGPDSLLVLTQGRPPRGGDRARIHGTISRSFPVAGRERVVLLSAGGPGEGEASGRSDTR